MICTKKERMILAMHEDKFPFIKCDMPGCEEYAMHKIRHCPHCLDRRGYLYGENLQHEEEVEDIQKKIKERQEILRLAPDKHSSMIADSILRLTENVIEIENRQKVLEINLKQFTQQRKSHGRL